MGLDMYLNKRTYVKNWEHNGPDAQNKITIKTGGKARKDIKPERITYITEEVAYWRKFNALHNWFVQNCGHGEDTCQEMYVSKDQLEELLALLHKVNDLLKNSKMVHKVVAGWKEDRLTKVYECEDQVMELLPPTQGCFFGSYEIDQWYKDDVVNTIIILEDLLSENTYEDRANGIYGGDFYYQASW